MVMIQLTVARITIRSLMAVPEMTPSTAEVVTTMSSVVAPVMTRSTVAPAMTTLTAVRAMTQSTGVRAMMILTVAPAMTQSKEAAKTIEL